jgi:hypothetical protein
MTGRAIGTIGGWGGAATAALILLGAATMTFSQGDGKGTDPLDGTSGERGTSRSAIPPIDRRNPAGTETATFALG